MHRTEHAATTALVCMDRLTRLMALGEGEKTAASRCFSMRYGTKEGKYCFHYVESEDPLSLMVQESNGVIYEEYDNGPRLLCEALISTVHKDSLMEAAIKFFFPRLNDVNKARFGACSEYCYQATDSGGLTVLIIFGFEDFGEAGHINLLLHGKFQLVNGMMDNILNHIKTMPTCTLDDFTQRTAEYVCDLTDGGAEMALTDVMSHGVVGKPPFEMCKENKLWPQTDLTRLIRFMRWSVYDYSKEYMGGGVVICADMIIRNSTDTQQLIPAAICQIQKKTIDVRLAYNINKPFTNLCWRATNKEGLVSMVCFQYEWAITKGGQQTYKLIMYKISMNGMDFENLLGKLKASANWRRITDSSKFSNDILFEAKKEQMRLRRLGNPPPLNPAV